MPSRLGGNLSKSGAYIAFRLALEVTGVKNRTRHATRNTFISITRTKCERPDVLENVTHTSRGDTIDIYTAFEWRPLCDAVGSGNAPGSGKVPWPSATRTAASNSASFDSTYA